MKFIAAVVVFAALVACVLAVGDPRCINQPVGAAFCNRDLDDYEVCLGGGQSVTMPVADGTKCEQIPGASPPAIRLVNLPQGWGGLCRFKGPGQYCTFNRRAFFNCPGGELQPVAPGTLCNQLFSNGQFSVQLVHDTTNSQGPSYCQDKPAGQYCTDDNAGYFVCPGGEFQPMAPGTVCAYLSLNPPAVVGVFPKQETSCAAIKSANPAAADGDYTIYYKASPSRPIQVYCADMNSGPKEYLRLQYPTTTTYAQHNSLVLVTYHSRVRLLLNSLVLDACDLRFVTADPSFYQGNYMGYGTSGHCSETAHPQPGSKVDLRGTGVRLAAGANSAVAHGIYSGSPSSFIVDVNNYGYTSKFPSGNTCGLAWMSNVATTSCANGVCLVDTLAASSIPGLKKCDSFNVNNDNRNFYKPLRITVESVVAA